MGHHFLTAFDLFFGLRDDLPSLRVEGNVEAHVVGWLNSFRGEWGTPLMP